MKLSKEKIVFLRKERGWSQEKLAIIAGLGERTIQRIEKEGNASLESALALASAFELSPKDLQQEKFEVAPQLKSDNQNINWAGLLGLVVLIFVASMVIELTAKYKTWEMISAGLVLGLSIIFSFVSFGFNKTKSLIMATGWIVKFPKEYAGLNQLVLQAKSLIDYLYIVGLVSAIVCGLTIAVHTDIEPDHIVDYLTYLIRPLVYAILFAEIWIRPLKNRLEYILQSQISTEQ
ncbi:MAG: helix-turn-helix domain-containing protein [Colwellia sp.]|nr:helix-turn-helix domain-containing protein [Colwellia sp.]